MNTAKPVRFSQRALSWLIISLLVWQPVAPSFAAVITPTSPAAMDKAANGVPVVNIATPNAAGISHNQFHDYNVGKEGLILNNATGQLTQTQLGGLIQNNPNLRAGQEAHGIINEVTGGSRSQLQGYTEVAGKAANVMVANPYGITCSGCGFINTPNVTLTTGKPQFDTAGNLAALDVTKGTITVEGKGLDASSSDALSLISRATEVNAAIHAKDLTVTAGANRIDANGKATAITGEGIAPVVAVDTGALGGMYANRIHLVSTEKGVGVNLGNLTARQGDIALDASGRMVIRDSIAGGSLTAKANSLALSGSHKTGGDIAVTAAQDVVVSNATLAADSKLVLSGSGTTSLTSSALTSGGSLSLAGKQLYTDVKSEINASGSMTLTAQEISQQGNLISGGDAQLTVDTLDNRGSVAAKGKLSASATTLTNSGTLQGQTLAVSGGIVQNNGTLAADGALRVDAGALTTDADSVITGKTDVALTVQTAADLDGLVSADNALSVNAGELQTRRNAQLQSGGDMTLTATGNAKLDGTQAAKGAFDASAKKLSHGGKTNASSIALNGPDKIVNSGTLLADTLNLSSGRITNSGLLQGTRALKLQTDWLDNLYGGTLYSTQDVTLSIPGLNNSGLITTDSDLYLRGDALVNGGEINGVNLVSDYTSLANHDDGRLLADGQLTVFADSLINEGLMAAKTVSATANMLNNQGNVQGDNALTLAVQNTTNSGSLATGGTLNLNGRTLDNSGNLSASELLLTLGKKLDNVSTGRVVADNLLTLNAPVLLNSGLVAAKNLELTGADITSSGTLQGINALTITGVQLTNQQGGLLLSNGNITLKNDRLDNAGQIQGNTLNLATGKWVNTGVALGENGLEASVNGTLDNQGKVVSQQMLTVQASTVDNSGTLMAKVLALHGDLRNSGLIQANDELNWQGTTFTGTADGQMLSVGSLTLQGTTLDNYGRMQGRNLTARADNWHNGGTVQVQDSLNATLGVALDNQGQMLSQGVADIRTAQLTNDGKLAAKDLAVTAPEITSNGILQGNDSLTLATLQLLNGSNGQLVSGSGLDLNLDTLNNQGLLYVQDGLTLTGNTLVNGGNLETGALDGMLNGTLDNSGTLLAHNHATLQADQLTNSGSLVADSLALTGKRITNSGLLQGTQQWLATADNIANTTGGRVLSGGALSLGGSSLSNAGTVQGDTVTLRGDTLDNLGLINGLHGLTGTYSSAITSNGQMVSGGATDLRADSVTGNGRITGDTLTLNAATLNNDGLWQGTHGLTLNADTLTTGTGSRTLSGGDFTVSAGQLTTGGTLQGGQVSVTADNWTLSGTLLSQGDLTASIGNTLNLPGALESQGAMALSAQTLNNNGQLLSAGDVTLRGQQLTNNGTVQGKTLTAHQHTITNNGTLTGLDYLTLDNRQTTTTLMARIAMATPQLELINGAKGSLLTQGTLDINAGVVTNAGLWQGNNILLAAQSLENSGAIQSAGALNLALSGSLNAAAGSKITAMGTAVLQALALTNDGQWGAKNLTLNANTLNNSGSISGIDGLTATLTGAVNQQANAALASNGALNLSAASVDNAGKLQGADLTVSAATLTNRSGAEAVSTGALTLTTPSLFNYGLIQGAGGIRIDATRQAMNAGKVLSGARLTLTTPQYSGAGWLQATNLVLNAANNNGTGTLLADQMTLTGDTFTNQGTTQAGNLVLNYRQLTNNGTLLGNNQLTVNATQVDQSASGKLFSGGDLFVGATGMNALGQVVALGNLTLQLANTFSGKTTLAAGKILNVTSNGAIDNQSVMQGQAVNLSAGGQLTNNGQITTGSGASTLSGSNIVLNGNSAIQGGGDVTLTSRGNITANGFAGTLGNLTLNAPGAIINTALLYAANNLALYANSITNQRGDMLAGNSLWLQKDAAGNANSEVINTSGNIETRNGDITVKTGHLLNQRDGLTASSVTTTYDVMDGIGDPTLRLHYSKLPDGTYGYYTVKYYEESPVCGGKDGGCPIFYVTSYYYAPFEEYATYKYVLSETRTDVTSSGAGARITSGRNANIAVNVLDNRASDILSTGNMVLQGTQLNNQSWQNSITTDAITYKYDSENYATNTLPDDGLSNHGNNVEKYNQYINYKFQGHGITTTQGQIYRAVIQAGGNITASFSSNISNTTTTANAGGVSGTIAAPSLNTLSNQSIGGSVTKQALANSPAAVNSPQWQDQLQNTLRQINGGGSLDNNSASDAALSHISGQQKDNASLGNAGSLADAGVTNAVLKNVDNVAPGQYQGKSVDTSAYPLPSGNNGYFVVSENPKSPYLITVNPKLDGLGQLDPKLFGDLNKLLGISPSAAPRETNSAYTDEKQFLGSSYMLDRIKLNPDYDYRFLGDAAFDTRYVSNTVLNQTGSRYLNGIGSDLAQMQYLMDNAASAQQALGLQFGVSLTVEQVAALDHSILWWESATINGETVLIPKLYLSAKDVTVNNGSVIAGNNVSLEGGNVTNSGSTLLARNDLSVNSDGQITNSNDALLKAGGNVDLSAIGDINNLSSIISGKTVALESFDGSISNITLADQYSLDTEGRGGSVSLKDTTLGSIGSITALDALSLTAGKDITHTGSTLAAGGDLLMDAGGNIVVSAITKNDVYSQSGFARKTATNNADVTYQGSAISAGGNIAMLAGDDLTLSASDVSAGKNAQLSAGNDLNLNAQQTSHNSRNGNSETHSTDLDRATVSAGGDLTLAAGRDITAQAAGLAAEESLGLQAGRDVNLLAEATTQGNSEKAKKKTVINEQVRQQGTELASGADTVIIAGRDMNAEAASVTAKGDIGVQAGRDITLTTATESDYHYQEQVKTKSGFLSKTKTHTISEQSATREFGTLLSGDNVTLSSGNDLLVKGSAVAGDGDVALNAGHNVSVEAATNTDSNWQFKEKKKSGLMSSGGIGFSIGTSKTKQDLKENGTTQSQSYSTVGSTGGDVTITAGNQIHIGGSDLIASQDMALSGDSVVIEPGHDKRTSDQTFEQKTSGLTVALSGAVGDAVNTAVTTAMAVKEQSDDRLASLRATKAVLSGIQAGQANRLAEAVSGSDPMSNGAFGVMASLGSQSSKSTSHSEQDTTSGSTLNAGNNLSISATGKGKETSSGDIAIAGSQLKAGKDLTLDAARDITLTGVADTQKTTGSNTSKGGSIGVGLTAGPGGMGVSVSASANAAKGGEKGNGTAWNETTLDAGQNVSLTSGRDMLLQGTQVNGETVKADVGRDLTLSSLQDSDDYNSRQQSISGGLNYTFGGGAGASFSYSREKINSTYDSVQEQTGIFAGEGGFDVMVGNHTQLDGAVIASRADADKNRLETGTLGFSDIHNEADYKTQHQGAGFSTGGGIAGNLVSNMASTMLSGLGGSGHAEGTTQSAVAEGTIVIRDAANQQQDVAALSRDTEHANGSIDPIFDKEKEQRRLQTAQMIGEIGNQVADIARTEGKIAREKAMKDPVALKAAKETLAGLGKVAPTDKEIAEQAGRTAEAQFGIGSSLQRGITAATAAIQALSGGDVKSAIAGVAAPEIAYLIGQNVKDDAAKVIAHAVVNAALAAATGKNAAAAAAGAAAGEIAGKLALELYKKRVGELSEEQKQTVSVLATLASGLAGGLVGDSGANAVVGAQAGKTTVENNSLAGDKARESVKQSAEWWKTQVRNKLGENIASQLVNGLINASSETSDFVMLGGDTAFDLTAALATCATGGSYCGQAQSDLAKKDAGAAATLTAIMNGDAWEGIKSTTIKAANGDQKALESFAGVLSGALVSAKVLPSGGASANVAGKAESATVNAGKATSGAENAATYPKLKDDLVQQNLNNIAKQDPRLAAVVQGDNGKLNYGVGSSTKAEADRLGKIWVGDGARLTSDGSGLMSADKTRVYRFPASKDNSSHATTGTQANFETYKINPVTGDKTKIGNGHLDIN
ncbi:hemagglutinin repeat-containing protein [Salmonella enterica]